MKFATKVQSGNLLSSKYSVLIVPAFEDLDLPNPLRELDKAFKGFLSQVYENDVLKKVGEVSLVRGQGTKGPARIAFVGMGKSSDLDLESVRQAASTAGKYLKIRNHDYITFLVESFIPVKYDSMDTVRALLEGALLGTYTFDRFKTEKETQHLTEVEFHIPAGPRKPADFAPLLDETMAVTTSTLLARDWANTPSNYSTPLHLAQLAKDIGRDAALNVKVLGYKECEKLGMGAFLGVAKGSRQEPQFIIMDYKPRNFTKTFCMVGKALNFDSGGISIKPALDMHTMKADMGGGIAVISTMRAIGIMSPPGVRIVGIVPACENMPDGNAQKPGDIATTQSGISIEILNTDAEGRLVLADGLEYAAREYNPDVMIDIATLTGACAIALGLDIAGYWTDHENLVPLIEAAAATTSEKVWRMPLEKNYKKQLKSLVADVSNIGKREGGAITAALFLQHFTGDVPWMHIDIAGPFYTMEDKPYSPKGSTGYGPRLLYHFIKIWSES